MSLTRCLHNQKNKKIKIFLQQSYYYCNIKWIHKYLVKSQVHKIRDFLKNSIETNVKIYLFTNQCHCWKQLSLGWVGFQKYTTFFQNEPLCNDWAKFTSYSSRLKRIYNLHENPFLHVNVFGTPEYQKKWWGKLFLMRMIRPPPPRPWLGLTNVPKNWWGTVPTSPYVPVDLICLGVSMDGNLSPTQN